jgi:threonine/homoserine/homoserine lactone efflux protein
MLDLDLLALGGLLLTPGPTNILLAFSAVSSGVRRTVPMLGAAVLAYMAIILAVAALAALIPAGNQIELRTGVRICAVLWLLWLAHSVWTTKDDSVDVRLVTVRQVFLTTLINPKAMIVALLVQSEGMTVQFLATIAALVGLAGAAWIVVGLVVRRSGSSLLSQRSLRQASAICLAGFGIILAGSSL